MENKKIIEREDNFLRIGETKIPINILREDIDTELGIRYYQFLYRNKFYETWKERILKEILTSDNEYSVKKMSQELREAKIQSFCLGKNKNKFNEKYFSFSEDTPNILIDFKVKTEDEKENNNSHYMSTSKIQYKIIFNSEIWKKPYSILAFIEEIVKEFDKLDYSQYIFDEEYNIFKNALPELEIDILIPYLETESIGEINSNIWKYIMRAYRNLEAEYNIEGEEKIKFFINGSDLKFVLKQYLIGFPEFIRKITGKTIQFEIETDVDGLIFKIGQDENQDEIQKELTKYMEFLKDENMNFEELKELNLNPVQLIGIRSFVRAQVMNYRHQLENLNDLLKFEKRSNEFLDKTNERLSETIKIVGGLFEKHIENNKIDTVNISVNNQLENKNTIDIDIKFNENIEKLQESVFEMKNLLNPLINDFLKKELQEIDNGLTEIDDSQELNKNKGIIGKLKRFVNGMKEANGTIVLAGQAIAASGEIIQDLLKLKDMVINTIAELMK